MKELKDTQNERDDRNLAIDRVGVKGLRFPVEVSDKGGTTQRTCYSYDPYSRKISETRANANLATCP